MGFTLPNSASATYTDQAEPDAGDFLALGDRRTGVISGGAVTAQVSANMTVVVASAVVIINDVRFVSAAAPNAPVQPFLSSPRFDNVGIDNTGSVLIIQGIASNNPVLPVFDPATFCWLYTLYVHAGTVQSADIIDKRIFAPLTFQRSSADSLQPYLATTARDSGNIFSVSSGGLLAWGSSALSRVSAAATKFATSLTLQSIDETGSPTPLIVKAGSTFLSAAAQKLASFRSSSNTEVAFVNGAGQGYFDNIKFGAGTPVGAVTGLQGDLYIDRSAPRNAAVWICEANGNTNWFPFRTFVQTESALPVGSYIEWAGMATDPIPAGTVLANGASYSTSGIYAALFNLLGYRCGGAGASFNVPNFTGRMPIAAGGAALNVGVGVNAGSADGTTVLDGNSLPTHGHVVSDPGHLHYKPDFAYIWKPPEEPQQLRAASATIAQPIGVPFMAIETINHVNPVAATGIVIGLSGRGLPFPTLGPVQGVTYLIKL